MASLIVVVGVWMWLDKLFGSVAGSSPLLGTETHSGIVFGTIGFAVVLSLVSFWDDRYRLSPAFRFGIHAMVTAGIIWVGHLTVKAIPVPFGGALSLGLLSVPFTFFFIMWMTNLYNFMDGMDGFAGGMTVLGFGFLAYLGWAGGHQTILLISLLVASAGAGFLLWNYPPAKIFMGDVGSTSLGFLAGGISVLGIHDGLFDLWVPVLIFSPFIVDATVTLFRRLVQGKKVWQAHREHYYQRLVLAGWGHRKTVLAEYGLMLACGASALLYWKAGQQWRFILLIVWIILYSALAYGVRAVEERCSAQLRDQA